MLIRFAVENFRSFRDRQEISLVASALKGLPTARIKASSVGVDLLRVLAIYGANASGKTAVIRALAYMSHAVRSSQRQWSPEGGVPREPFLLDGDSSARTSTFEADLVIEGTRYTYGFEVDSQCIRGEWLFAYPNGKRQRWFERTAGSEDAYTFGKHLLGENRAIRLLTRSNSLFLSAAAQNGHQQLLPIYRWFTSTLAIVNPDSHESLQRSSAQMCDDEATRNKLVALLAAADLGIVDVEVTEEELDEKVLSAVRALVGAMGEEELKKFESAPVRKVPRVRLLHAAGGGDERVLLPFEDESEGTQTLFALAGPITSTLDKGGVLCVDELDASLHPLLALHIVRLFNSSTTNPRDAQLIFNTHDTNLLDASVLRRDQIWFVEKDRGGATQLYPLSDFQPRKEENLERGYLQGRYGAVPFLGDLNQLAAAHGE